VRENLRSPLKDMRRWFAWNCLPGMFFFRNIFNLQATKNSFCVLICFFEFLFFNIFQNLKNWQAKKGACFFPNGATDNWAWGEHHSELTPQENKKKEIENKNSFQVAKLTISGTISKYLKFWFLMRNFASRFLLRFAQPFLAKLKWTINWSLSLKWLI